MATISNEGQRLSNMCYLLYPLMYGMVNDFREDGKMASRATFSSGDVQPFGQISDGHIALVRPERQLSEVLRSV